MFRFHRFALTPILGLSLVAGAAQAEDGQTPQQKLDAALAGYQAGEPVDCISQYTIQDVQIFDRTALLYKVAGDRFFLNVPDIGAQSLNNWDVLVTETFGSQLCSLDTVKLWDPGSRMETGFVGLGRFVPYTRPDILK